MKRALVLLAILCCSALWLLSQSTNHYYIYRQVSAETNRITVRQPTTSGKPLALAYIQMKSSIACPYNITKNGTVTGGSEGTALAMDERGRASVSDITLDGTVSGDTVVWSDSLAANTAIAFEGVLYLPFSSGSPRQFTIEQECSGAGTLTLYLEWREP